MKLSEIFARPVLEDEDGSKVDDGKGPVELTDLIQRSGPKFAKKYLDALWGKPRLVFHGVQIFDGVQDALDDAQNQGFEVQFDLPIDLEHELGIDSFEFEAQATEMKQEYLGYSPSEDCLYVGADVWVDEESFNQAWDEQFEEKTGEEYDESNEEHARVFDHVWKKFLQDGFTGALFKLEPDGDAFKYSEEATVPGGFHRGIRSSKEFKSLKLIDLY